jgi:transcriptional regulator with XRE-family HTH domain
MPKNSSELNAPLTAPLSEPVCTAPDANPPIAVIAMAWLSVTDWPNKPHAAPPALPHLVDVAINDKEASRIVASPTFSALLDMDFPERLVQLRKAKGLKQRQHSEQIAIHLTQVQRYKNGSSQPTLDVLRKLALVLGVSADVLLFDQSERGPDEALKLKFEAIRTFTTRERAIAEGVLDSLIVQHQAKQLFRETETPLPEARAVTAQSKIGRERRRAAG